LDRKEGGPHNQYGRGGKEKKSKYKCKNINSKQVYLPHVSKFNLGTV